MKYLLPILLLSSCAFADSIIKPVTVAGAAAIGAVLGGPGAGAVAAGGVSAAWDIVDAEEKVKELEESRDETFRRLLNEASPKMRDDILTTEAVRREAELSDTRSYFEKKIDQLIYWLVIAGIVYLIKQPVWAYLTRRRIKKEKLA